MGNNGLVVCQTLSPILRLPAHVHHGCQHPRPIYNTASRIKAQQARLEGL